MKSQFLWNTYLSFMTKTWSLKIFVYVYNCKNMVIYSVEFTLFLAVDCGPLLAPMNGSFSGNSTVFPNSVLFNCDPGFILNGSTIRTCQPDRTWSGFPTICSGMFDAPTAMLFSLTNFLFIWSKLCAEVRKGLDSPWAFSRASYRNIISYFKSIEHIKNK